MSCTYVCLSCRRELQRRLAHRIATARGSRNASFTALDEKLEEELAESSGQDRGRRRYIPVQQPLQPLEKDFLERVLQGRSLGSGPYSNPRRRKRAVIEDKDKTARDTRLASGFFRQSQTPRITKQAAWLSFRSSRPVESSMSVEGSDIAFSQALYEEVPKLEPVEDPAVSGSSAGDAPTSDETKLANGSATGPPVFKTTSSDTEIPVRKITHTSKEIKIPWQDEVVTLIDTICDDTASIEESWAAFLNLARGDNLLALRSNEGARNLLLKKVFRAWSSGKGGGLVIAPSTVLRRFQTLNLDVRPRQRKDAVLAVINGALVCLRDNPPRDPQLLDSLRKEITVLWRNLVENYSNHPATATAQDKKRYFDAMIRRAQKYMPELKTMAVASFLVLWPEQPQAFGQTEHEEPFKVYAQEVLAKEGVSVFADLDAWDSVSSASPEVAKTLVELVRSISMQLRTSGPEQPQPLQARSKVSEEPSESVHRPSSSSAEESKLSQSSREAAYASEQSSLHAPSLSGDEPQPSRRPQHPAKKSERGRQAADAQSVGKQPRRQWTPTSQEAFEEVLIKRIGRANTRREASWLDALWKEAFDIASREGASMTISPDIYTHFLVGYMAARRPAKAIEIWNYALQSKTQPTVQMWDALLRGFGNMRDAKGVQEIWGMLIVATQPDAHLWASRIQGLANSGVWRAATQAFQQMLTEWLNAAQRSRRPKKKPLQASDLPSVGGFAHAPKPTTEALNGLIPALARVRQHEDIALHLQSARRIGVKPDVYTFNAILKGALRDGDQALVDKLFAQMKKEDVQPDLATFTMLMDSLFRESIIQDAEPGSSDDGTVVKLRERQEEAGQLLNTLHEYGMEGNTWTFGAIINGVLKTNQDRSFLTYSDISREKAQGIPRGSITAAYTVLDHMTKQRVPLSSSIYTALATAHFQERPEPDMKAIDTLWQRSKKDQNVPMDVVFYDRLIEGYARHERLRDMKLVLAQAARKSRSPGWIALNAALTALGKAKDWTAAEDLVYNVKREEHNQDVVRARMGKAFFIRTCQQLGYDTTGLVRNGDEDE